MWPQIGERSSRFFRGKEAKGSSRPVRTVERFEDAGFAKPAFDELYGAVALILPGDTREILPLLLRLALEPIGFFRGGKLGFVGRFV